MKRVVIISYYFPPGKKPANRTLSWFKFFPDLNIYPIIITRNEEEEDRIEQLEKGEIHRIKAPKTYSERLANSKYPTIFKILLSKLYNLTIGVSKYDKTYQYFNQYFIEHLSDRCDILIVTGSPFILFRLGYYYAKNLKGKWVADYRDMWHLSDMPRFYDSFLEKIVRRFVGLKIEKKWINTSSHISVASTFFVPKIRRISEIDVSPIENGYFEEEHLLQLNTPKNKELSFVYVGTIYKTQKIAACIQVIGDALKNENQKGKIAFIGSSFKRELRIFIEKWNSDFLDIEIISKVSKEKCLQIQSSFHFGIMCSYGVKGVPASKLYEFLGMRQPVLLYPSDNDIIEDTLLKANLGFCYSNYQSALDGVQTIIREFQHNKIYIEPNNKFIESFTRRNLANKYYLDILSKL